MLNNNNSFNFNINAVNGTLRKSHPESKFCIKQLDNRSLIFDNKKPRLDYRDEDCQVVILQVMLIGDNGALIEYVEKRHWEAAK